MPEKNAPFQDKINLKLVEIGPALVRLESITKAMLFRIDRTGASCKRLGRSKTGTDANKWEKPRNEIEVLS